MQCADGMQCRFWCGVGTLFAAWCFLYVAGVIHGGLIARELSLSADRRARLWLRAGRKAFVRSSARAAKQQMSGASGEQPMDDEHGANFLDNPPIAEPVSSPPARRRRAIVVGQAPARACVRTLPSLFLSA